VAAALYIYVYNIIYIIYIRTVLPLLFFIYSFISSSPNRYVSTLTTAGRGLCRPNIDDKAATPPLLILRPSWRDTAYQWYAKWCILDHIVYLKLARVLTKSHCSSRQLSVNICQLCTDYNMRALALLKYPPQTILLDAACGLQWRWCTYCADVHIIYYTATNSVFVIGFKLYLYSRGDDWWAILL